MGRAQEEIVECSKAVELDPLSLLYNGGLAQAYYNGRDYTQAIEQANKTLEINPKQVDAVETLGGAYEQMGNYKSTLEQWIKAEQLERSPGACPRTRTGFRRVGLYRLPPGRMPKTPKPEATTTVLL